MVRYVLCAVTLVSLIGAAHAQPVEGDLLLGDIGTAGNLMYIERNTGNLRTLLAAPTQAGGFQNNVLMALNNIDVISIEDAGTEQLLQIDPSGTIVTMFPLGTGIGSPNAGDVTQTGGYVISSSDNAIREVDAGGSVTTIFTGLPATQNGIARDHDNNTYLAGIFSAGLLLRYDPRTNTLNTLCTGMGSVSGVDPMPRGFGGAPAYAVSTFTAPSVRVCSGGTVVTTYTSPGTAQGLKVDDATGNTYVCTTAGHVVEIDATGTTVTTWGPFGGRNWTGVEVYGSRKIVGAGTGAPGSPYSITMNFGQNGAGGLVLTALSLGQRPGIPIPGVGTVNLAVDNLFIASVQGLLNGAVLSGFPATLDPFGRGGGNILIPATLPSGLTFYFSAISIVNQSIVNIANTIGVTT